MSQRNQPPPIPKQATEQTQGDGQPPAWLSALLQAQQQQMQAQQQAMMQGFQMLAQTLGQQPARQQQPAPQQIPPAVAALRQTQGYDPDDPQTQMLERVLTAQHAELQQTTAKVEQAMSVIQQYGQRSAMSEIDREIQQSFAQTGLPEEAFSFYRSQMLALRSIPDAAGRATPEAVAGPLKQLLERHVADHVAKMQEEAARPKPIKIMRPSAGAGQAKDEPETFDDLKGDLEIIAEAWQDEYRRNPDGFDFDAVDFGPSDGGGSVH